MNGDTLSVRGTRRARVVSERIHRALDYRDLLSRAHNRSFLRREWIPYHHHQDVLLEEDDVLMTDDEASSEDDANLQAAIDFSLMPEFAPEYRCTPATDQEISSLAVKSLSADKEGTCVICAEKMTTGDPCFDLPCSHDMHEACMREWFKSGRVCPICRDPLFADPA